MTAATQTNASVRLADRWKLDVDQPHRTALSMAPGLPEGACVRRLEATKTQEN
jgi:hypothetical protein